MPSETWGKISHSSPSQVSANKMPTQVVWEELLNIIPHPSHLPWITELLHGISPPSLRFSSCSWVWSSSSWDFLSTELIYTHTHTQLCLWLWTYCLNPLSEHGCSKEGRSWAPCLYLAWGCLLLHKCLQFLKTESQKWESKKIFLPCFYSLSSLSVISLPQLLLGFKSLGCWKEKLWERNVREVRWHLALKSAGAAFSTYCSSAAYTAVTLQTDAKTLLDAENTLHLFQ